jgi:hypothetical protein
MYGFREFVEAGGLLSYAADLAEGYRTLATSVDKVLRGSPFRKSSGPATDQIRVCH